jgi:predicted membrane protein
LPEIKKYFIIESRIEWTKRKVRFSAFILLILFLIFYFGLEKRLWPILAFSCIFSLAPKVGLLILPKIEKLMLLLIHCLNLMLLSIVFYGVITPFGLWRRSKDQMHIRWPSKEKDFRETSEPLRENYFVDPY